MLSDFFRINLPYGIARNSQGEWMAFNREYKPLGYNKNELGDTTGVGFLDLPIYTSYKSLSEELLIDIALNADAIHRNENGEIIRIFLYNDGTNPLSNNNKDLWNNYFERLKKLSVLKIAKEY